MRTVKKAIVKKVQRLSQKYHDDLQRIFDEEMDQDTYESSPSVEIAVIAQGYALEAAESEVAYDGDSIEVE